MNSNQSHRAQRRQAIQQRMLKNRNLLGKADILQEPQQPTIL